VDYVLHKKQFQLHSLLTEQRHPKTWNVSSVLENDVEEGLRQILSVDEDIAEKFRRMAADTSLLEQAAQAVATAIKAHHKIFLYGCGATGRLAKLVESAIWRPFWKKTKKSGVWPKLRGSIPEDIEDRLIGEMTGGDRALISSLEGFEDLELIGKLQLEERGVQRGDAVFCITEGGETSSVIGAVRAARAQYGILTAESTEEAKNNLYFIYNNPDDVLNPFERSRSVIEEPAITKINLATGPQAIAGSTRMQATTAETFLMGVILEAGIHRVLKAILSAEEMRAVGFQEEYRIDIRLRYFGDILEILRASAKKICDFTRLESATYRKKNFATYFAKKALITVFTDCTERSPTFHLYPLDTVREKRRNCWFQVWTEGKDGSQAWKNFLGRDFFGLEEAYYRSHLIRQIEDKYLKKAATKSLSQAGNDQKELYDFSFSADNIDRRGPQHGDLGILVCMDEEVDDLTDPESGFSRFAHLFKKKNARVVLILVGDKNPQEYKDLTDLLPSEIKGESIIPLPMGKTVDPLGLNRHTLLKILLNTHSTAVMARLGRIVGNTMTNVNPSNLKLIGRATFLILSHVNDVLCQDEWQKKWGKTAAITYDQANAVLFEAMDYVARKGGQTSEVELSILRILEALRNGRYIGWDEAFSLSQIPGLSLYLQEHNPAFRHQEGGS
jgi:N-acetylmuramic acid 6-phosphate (MurNAc-6-P) etherase